MAAGSNFPGSRFVLLAKAMEELVRKAQAGDRAAVEQLLSEHRQQVFALAYTLLKDASTAEEAAQEAFVRVFSRLPTLKKPSRFKSWCLTITANYCRDLLRRKRPVLIPLESVPEPALPESEAAPDEELVAALESLPSHLKEALLLRDVEGFNYQEVADIQRVPVGTVKSRIYQARQKLRKWITRCKVNR